MSKVPGGPGASDKFMKQQAEKKGLGAENAPGHTQGKRPGEEPVASDSGQSSVGVDTGANQPGEQGIKGPYVPSSSEAGGRGTGGQATMK